MHRTSLVNLPVELLYDIQHFALSEHLPHTSRHLYTVFKSAPTSVHAQYLLGRHLQSPAPSLRIVTKALRYPLCTPAVLAAVLRDPACPPPEPLPELPRRLFRALAPRLPHEPPWAAHDAPLPLLRHLYSAAGGIPAPDANAHDGYALTRAVFAGAAPLVRFLLARGAAPACKDGMAVMVAIRRKDLGLVRMLVERDYVLPSAEDVPMRKRRLGGARGDEERKPSGGGRGGAKKRRLEDRVEVTKDMLKAAVKCDARDIVDYLAQEKGCVPDMQTLRMLRR